MHHADGIILCSIENEWEMLKSYLSYGKLIACNEYNEDQSVSMIRACLLYTLDVYKRQDLDYVAQYADQVILIDGTVKKQGTVRQVYELSLIHI